MAEEPLKILLVAHGLPPESVGGVEQHVEGLAQALVHHGHEVTIYARTARAGAQGTVLADAPGEPATAWGCRVFRVVYRHEGLNGLADLYRCDLLDQAFAGFLQQQLGQGQRFDVAHVHHLTGVSVGILDHLRAAQIPVVLTLHDYWLMCPRGQMWHRLEEPCERVEPARCAGCLAPTFPAWLPDDDGAAARVAAVHQQARDTLASANRLISPSARTIRFFEGLGIDPGRIHVVANGVDVDALAAVPPPPAEGPLRVGYLGSLIPSKGLHVLVAAFQRLWHQLQDAPDSRGCRLDIHGNTVPYHGDTTYLDRVFGNLPAAAPIHHHGPYATGDLPRLLATVDVVVAPALWEEAFGLTVREAMAAGRAVICSRIGGLQDAIEDGVQGFVVPPGNPAALHEALARLAQDRGRLLQMAAAGGRQARGFAAMALDLAGHYRALA
ncbi:MAG: glycosyltransferase family 4 protein [Planctomycetota bacterium]|jgi:glycosyltransferase involved in cell wall biosynthesis